jgi:hypothetical protein
MVVSAEKVSEVVSEMEEVSVEKVSEVVSETVEASKADKTFCDNSCLLKLVWYQLFKIEK